MSFSQAKVDRIQNNVVGTNLRGHRRRQGRSLRDIAEQLGVKKSTVSRWESGFLAPRRFRAADVLDAYGIDLPDERAFLLRLLNATEHGGPSEASPSAVAA